MMMHYPMICILLFSLITTIQCDVSLLYQTNRDSKTVFDCFHAYFIEDLHRNDKHLLRTNQLSHYCRRPLSTDVMEEIVEGYIENTHTFQSLRSQGMNSEDLFQWSIAIDTIEQYAKYLITNDTIFDEFIFRNCSSFWFGSHCQYTFASNVTFESFGDFVLSSFQNRKRYDRETTINTCYSYLSGCYRGPEPMCLDWREICDGKIDCIGDERFGIDEEHCHELEINECENDEYRCQNGAQCIPLEFFRDGWSNNDCLDGTDEDEIYRLYTHDASQAKSKFCVEFPTFNCEEKTCRRPHMFSCGDGSCLSNFGVTNFVGKEYGSCFGTGRDTLYNQAIYRSAKQLPKGCYKLLFCKLKFYMFVKDSFTRDDCLSKDWLLSINCTMKYLAFPLEPLVFGYFQPLYERRSLMYGFYHSVAPSHICHDRRLCRHLKRGTLTMGNLDCRPFPTTYIGDGDLDVYLEEDAAVCAFMGTIKPYTSNSSLFFCQSSRKYISKHRLIDGFDDCYYKEDENYVDSCSLNDSQRFTCTSENKCLSPVAIGLTLPHCNGTEDRQIIDTYESLYPRLCNSIRDTTWDTNEKDDMNCDWWPCYNPYTRCDSAFQCGNGMDELNCPNYNCTINEYRCQKFDSTEYYCIPQEYIYETKFNCTNDLDNTTYDREIFYSKNLPMNLTHLYVSWKGKTCLTKADMCGYTSTSNESFICNIFQPAGYPTRTIFLHDLDNNQTLCELSRPSHFVARKSYPFSSWNLGYLPSIVNATSSLPPEQTMESNSIVTPPKSMNITAALIDYCNRGIIIFEGKSYEKTCLCPPNYFGNQCEWQSQRISLTLQLRKLATHEKMASTVYHLFIYLIDDEHQLIHSYEEINYIPSIDCNTKYNRYLLYSTQPKNLNQNYSIHIDIYDKLTLKYYGSWHLDIVFPFLPVNRIAAKLIIPLDRSQPSINCSIDCGIHGICFDYINSPKSFCHCDEGYSGRFCNLTYECSCSLGSICLNSSICLCSLDRFGSECYLKHRLCQTHTNPCQNHGQCIPINDRTNPDGFICLCSENFMGPKCEYSRNRIDITFNMDPIPSMILAHFITAFYNRGHERTTIYKKIPLDQHSFPLYISQPFNILLIEFSQHYYLTVLRENYIPTEHISATIQNESICINISELVNTTILNWKSIRRVKYYHLPCYENKELKCFYDEQYMCICDENRFANCFDFNHTMSYDCQGYNHCENNGKCFQENSTCPRRTMCMCDKCYYGPKCQLTTKDFSLSLDVIFGYHINPILSFFKQSKAVKITTIVTMIMFVLGLINGIISTMTFRRKSSTKVGCGIYLLTNSIISLLTITIFTIKYWQLIIFQMNIITNYSFVYFNCLITDGILKMLLCSGDWLNACVAIERALAVVMKTHFDKMKSRSVTKYVIPIVLFMTSISYVHDPLSRQLLDDKDEERTWCYVNYSTKLRVFDKFIVLSHFLTPFIINFLSALIIIIQMFRIRSKAQPNSTRTTLFQDQIKQHRHLLISPCVLILLAVPRLIISFLSQCMKSARDPWLFLVGYYISFIPPLLIFVVFVLPSEKYKSEFLTAIGRSPRGNHAK